MNAAIFTKSAKGIILASGLIAASSVIGYASDVTIPLGSQATTALSTLYFNAPTGVATLGGHSFDLSSGNLIQLGNGQSASFSGSWTNPSGAYLLLNTFNTYLWYDQTAVGTVTITFADGSSQTTTLTVGSNIREWNIGSGFTDNSLTDPAIAQVWSGSAINGSAATIDMLTISLPATQNVTNVTISNINTWGALGINLAGLTLDQQNPQPTTQCIRPGASCSTPAADNSQASKWQPTTTTPSASPAATTTANPHANTSSSGIGQGIGGGKGHKAQ
jgi:hypothetical protein